MFIYKISFPDNPKVYIGKTINPKKRWWTHKYNAKNGVDCHIYRAMRLYGIETAKFEVIAESTKSNINSLEIKTIADYDSVNNGYNETIGGDGRSNFQTSEITKIKQRESSNAFKCKVTYKDGREQITISLKQFAKENGYHQGALSWVLSGKLPSHKDIIKVERLLTKRECSL